MTQTNAAAALDAVKNAEARLAQKAHWPWWRHAVYGVMMGLIVFGCSRTGAGPIPFVLLALVLVWLTIRDDRKRYGAFVSGYQPGATQWVTYAAIGLTAILCLLAFLAQNHSQNLLIGLGLAGFAFAANSVLSKWWEVVYRRSLENGDSYAAGK